MDELWSSATTNSATSCERVTDHADQSEIRLRAAVHSPSSCGGIKAPCLQEMASTVEREINAAVRQVAS